MATDPDDSDNRKAKDVVEDELDEQTRADLARWFGLPSFDEKPEAAPSEDDPEMVAVRERRDKAIAAVEPWMLEGHRRRTEPPEDLFKFKPDVTLRVDPDMGLLDMEMIDRAGSIADPREIEISEQLRDDMKECTPQAILRDLHRVETDFEKTFEMIDAAAEQRLDIVAEVDAAMKTSWALPPLAGSPWTEARSLIEDLRAERRKPWADMFKETPLPNRRWAPEDDR
jgi:hypothetical protein